MELPELCDCRPKGLPGKKQCVLSIDGGGVRGIMATVILESLESELQVPDTTTILGREPSSCHLVALRRICGYMPYRILLLPLPHRMLWQR